MQTFGWENNVVKLDKKYVKCAPRTWIKLLKMKHLYFKLMILLLLDQPTVIHKEKLNQLSIQLMTKSL